jgi:hypothetical protein
MPVPLESSAVAAPAASLNVYQATVFHFVAFAEPDGASNDAPASKMASAPVAIVRTYNPHSFDPLEGVPGGVQDKTHGHVTLNRILLLSQALGYPTPLVIASAVRQEVGESAAELGRKIACH